MKRVDPSDPDLIVIGVVVNREIISARQVMQDKWGNNAVALMLQAAAQTICPNRHLTFSITTSPHTRMAGVECWEHEPHMSRENPYQSQASIDHYKWMLRGLVLAKLEKFLGPYYKPTSRVTRNEYFRRSLFTGRRHTSGACSNRRA